MTRIPPNTISLVTNTDKDKPPRHTSKQSASTSQIIPITIPNRLPLIRIRNIIRRRPITEPPSATRNRLRNSILRTRLASSSTVPRREQSPRRGLRLQRAAGCSGYRRGAALGDYSSCNGPAKKSKSAADSSNWIGTIISPKYLHNLRFCDCGD